MVLKCIDGAYVLSVAPAFSALCLDVVCSGVFAGPVNVPSK